MLMHPRPLERLRKNHQARMQQATPQFARCVLLVRFAPTPLKHRARQGITPSLPRVPCVRPAHSVPMRRK